MGAWVVVELMPGSVLLALALSCLRWDLIAFLSCALSVLLALSLRWGSVQDGASPAATRLTPCDLLRRSSAVATHIFSCADFGVQAEASPLAVDAVTTA